MKIRFDFVMHWLYTIVWSLLALSGFSMIGAKYGWILNFDYVTADTVHRITAAIFVLLTLISIVYEIYRNAKNKKEKMIWLLFGRSGYQLFTFIVTLVLIITGAMIWICFELNLTATWFYLVMHEYISYLMLASLVWHIYMKSHALITRKKSEAKA